MTTPLVLRSATPADAGTVITLADLDSARVPSGEVLLAEVGDETWAAISLDDLHAVADPFRPSAGVRRTLLERARQLRRAA